MAPATNVAEDPSVTTTTCVVSQKFVSSTARMLRWRGSTLRDYVDAEGGKGAFQNLHNVYGREDEPCRRCKSPVQRIVLAGHALIDGSRDFAVARLTPSGALDVNFNDGGLQVVDVNGPQGSNADDEAEDLALAVVEREVVHRDQRPVALGDVLDDERGSGVGEDWGKIVAGWGRAR